MPWLLYGRATSIPMAASQLDTNLDEVTLWVNLYGWC
jgi:hypothetical protein